MCRSFWTPTFYLSTLGKTRLISPVIPPLQGLSSTAVDYHLPSMFNFRVWPACSDHQWPWTLGGSLSAASHLPALPLCPTLGLQERRCCGLRDHAAGGLEHEGLSWMGALMRKMIRLISRGTGQGLGSSEEGKSPGPRAAPHRALGDTQEFPGCLSPPCTPVHVQGLPAGPELASLAYWCALDIWGAWEWEQVCRGRRSLGWRKVSWQEVG